MKKPLTRRGSPEAIEKRRVARALNTLFGGKRGTVALDGRLGRRRTRLLSELKSGRRGRPLKALEVLSHANQLLALGESLTTIRKNGVLAPKVDPAALDDALVLRIQHAYAFHPEAWQLLGVTLADVMPYPTKNQKKPRNGPQHQVS